jgi:hypothetical protein
MKEIEYEIDSKGCWVCTSHAPNSYGYSKKNIAGKMYSISRLMYIKHKEEIPYGMEVRHTCDNTKCINPEHLVIGTHKDNMRDMAERRRSKNKYAKLNEYQVYLVKQYYPTFTERELSLMFKVGVLTIHRILTKL